MCYNYKNIKRELINNFNWLDILLISFFERNFTNKPIADSNFFGKMSFVYLTEIEKVRSKGK